MAPYSIEELRNIVSPIARAHGVASVSLFGSYAKGLADANSDVDLKIEKGALRSLFQLCGFWLAIEDALISSYLAFRSLSEIFTLSSWISEYGKAAN